MSQASETAAAAAPASSDAAATAGAAAGAAESAASEAAAGDAAAVAGAAPAEAAAAATAAPASEGAAAADAPATPGDDTASAAGSDAASDAVRTSHTPLFPSAKTADALTNPPFGSRSAQTASSTAERVPKWKNGDKAACRWDDGTVHNCEILDQRPTEAGTPSYYVHYVDFDRRLDDWVLEERMSDFVPEAVGASALAMTNSADATSGSSPKGASAGFLTRNQRRRMEEANIGEASHEEHGEGLSSSIQAQMEKEHFENTKVKNVRCIQLGRYEVDTWYFSPYPDGYSQDKLYVCEYCLKYYKKPKTLSRCCQAPDSHHPPGTEIYNDGLIRVYECDGRSDKLYCQCLCLLAKLFLDHKTLYYDVEPFLFYVFTETDGKGDCHVIGYFSKEKFSADDYNLACILTLPPYQRKGFGKFIIAFSYELSKVERKCGTPERPLSDLGQLSYKSFWTEVLVQLLWEEKCEKRMHSTVEEMSARTFIKEADIVTTLQSLDLVHYWKGQYVVNPASRKLEEHAKAVQASLEKRLVRVKSECLSYTPRVWEL